VVDDGADHRVEAGAVSSTTQDADALDGWCHALLLVDVAPRYAGTV